jgi:hypothetical protein
MIPVYQSKFIHIDGMGDCFNACVASILELPIRDVSEVLPDSPGVWYRNWQKFLKTKGYELEVCSLDDPPSGYSILSVETEKQFPEGHALAGQYVIHACVAFGGSIVHDPYPINVSIRRLLYYHTLTPISLSTT